MAIASVIESSGVHLVKSVMAVLTLKSNELILNMDDLRLAWGCLETHSMPFIASKYC